MLFAAAMGATGFSAPGAAWDFAAVQPASIVVQLWDCSLENRETVCQKQAEPRGNPTRWVTTDDYPARAQREGRGGIVHFRLESYPNNAPEGPGGKVRACTITRSSGHADIDAETCKLLQRRARFEPRSVTGSRTGIEGRMIWIPEHRIEYYRAREPIRTTGYVFGDPSDLYNICWTNRVVREGNGFRIYIDGSREPHSVSVRETRPEILPNGKQGVSFFLALGESVMFANNPHDTCGMTVVEKMVAWLSN